MDSRRQPLPVEQRALKENVAKMTGVAVFSDDIRDAVKGITAMQATRDLHQASLVRKKQ